MRRWIIVCISIFQLCVLFYQYYEIQDNRKMRDLAIEQKGAATTMADYWNDIALQYRDETNVCISMLPPEQRRSFQAQ